MTDFKICDKIKLPGDDEYSEITNIKETLLETEFGSNVPVNFVANPDMVLKIDELEFYDDCNDADIIFSSQDAWVMEISCNGIRFNREEFPDWKADDFAHSVCDILEKNYNVVFIKK